MKNKLMKWLFLLGVLIAALAMLFAPLVAVVFK